ncbi:MAG: 50S ribosomal protein L10 [Cytophagaceae bacterium]
MTREEKGVIIDDLSQKFAEHNFFYITDAAGLTVDEINKFRKLCYARGIEYKVVKNSLIKKALQSTKKDYSSFDSKVLKGFSGVLFSKESGSAPAKLLQEFRKGGAEKPIFKGASIDSDIIIGEENLDMLSKLKSKHELVGEIIGILQSPAKNVISALQSSGNKLSGIVKTLSERPETK